MVLVQTGVEEAVARRVPFPAAACVEHRVGGVFAGGQVAHMQLKELRALVVEGPEQAGVVRRVVGRTEAKVRLAFRQPVAVQQHLLRAALAGRAEEARLLAAPAVGRAVGIRAVLGGNRRVVFLDAPLHLGEKCFPQFLRIRHQFRLVGVLGLQMGADGGIQTGRVLEHLLPVRRAQPGILVDAGDAVMRVGLGPPFGLRRRDIAGKG